MVSKRSEGQCNRWKKVPAADRKEKMVRLALQRWASTGPDARAAHIAMMNKARANKIKNA